MLQEEEYNYFKFMFEILPGMQKPASTLEKNDVKDGPSLALRQFKERTRDTVEADPKLKDKLPYKGLSKFISLKVAFLVAFGQVPDANAQKCWIAEYNELGNPIYECDRIEDAPNSMNQMRRVLQAPVQDYYKGKIAKGEVISPEDRTKYESLGSYIPEGHVHQDRPPVEPEYPREFYQDRYEQAKQGYRDVNGFWHEVVTSKEQEDYEKEVHGKILHHAEEGMQQNEAEWKEYEKKQKHLKDQEEADKNWHTPRTDWEMETDYYGNLPPDSKKKLMSPDEFYNFTDRSPEYMHPNGPTATVIEGVRNLTDEVMDSTGKAYEYLIGPEQ